MFHATIGGKEGEVKSFHFISLLPLCMFSLSPFLVVSTVMIWPVMNLSKRENMVLFQHTPTSTGSHQLLTLEGKVVKGNHSHFIHL